jgi:hypothetical protein
MDTPLHSAWLLRAAAAALVLASACAADTPAGPSSGATEQLTVKLESAHFRIMGNRVSPSTVTAVADALELQFGRITADLGVAQMPVVTVKLWVDTESFYQEMAAKAGQRFAGATGFVGGQTEVSILDGANAGGRAVHEFAHVVSMAVNPRIGNNPRWLWEAVAIFEAQEFVDPTRLSYLAAGQFPTLASLSSDFSSSQQIYEVGYLLGEFVVATWDRAALIRLIQANGDTATALGITTSQFEQRWADFVRQKYFTPR